MKFVIFREVEKGKRKFFVEWNQDKITVELEKQLPGAAEAFNKVVELFKKESIKIP